MKQHLTRRKFLSTAALGGAVLAMDHPLLPYLTPPAIQAGLQVYSVRDAMAKDPAGVLKALHAMGYRKLEGYGLDSGKMFSMPVPDFMKLVKDNGLSMPSVHCKMKLSDYVAAGKDISDDLKKTIDLGVSQGITRIINPYMDAPDRAEIATYVKVFQAAAKYAVRAGGRAGYHNHDFEYTQHAADGRLLIEWILHETDPANFDMEMDIYWVFFAGHNPLDWFRLYPGRWKACHIKDMAKTEKRETVEVGEGSIDFKTVLNHRKEAGFQHYFVELEHYRTTSVEGVKLALDNFNKIKFR